MMFSKVFFFIFFSFFTVFLWFFNLTTFSSLSSFFYFSLDEKILFSFLGFSFDFISLFFIMMVSVVTCLVFLYSEVYMELYNNKKFFFLTLLFFFFMSFLSLSSGVMNVMIGWDGLGISSLLLIMFYPNKITFFNSFLTFFFNRLGDLMFMIFFCFFLMDYSSFFFFSKISNFYIIFIFFLCLMTKSAQFPFSSWLPAAMSAPTPISAMVHSSTLVTAGILLFFKFYNFFMSSSIFFFLMIFSLITFILGGFLGTIELDLKKIVAFSTMSQISMILFFMVTSISLAFFHTFGHALFKTLLFCSCGILFLWNFSDQLSKNIMSKNFNLSVIFFFLVSIYSMSGLIFSSSFYTKDLILEFFLGEKYIVYFFFLMIGSIMTVFYSSKIFCSIMFKPTLKFTFSFKLSHFFFIFIFTTLTIFFLKFLMNLTLFNMSCFLSSMEVLSINIMILLFFFFKFNLNIFYYLSMEILFMKNFFFSLNSKALLNLPNSISSSDNFFFKPSMMSLKDFNFDSSIIKFWVYMFILFLIFLLFF